MIIIIITKLLKGIIFNKNILLIYEVWKYGINTSNAVNWGQSPFAPALTTEIQCEFDSSTQQFSC